MLVIDEHIHTRPDYFNSQCAEINAFPRLGWSRLVGDSPSILHFQRVNSTKGREEDLPGLRASISSEHHISKGLGRIPCHKCSARCKKTEPFSLYYGALCFATGVHFLALPLRQQCLTWSCLRRCLFGLGRCRPDLLHARPSNKTAEQHRQCQKAVQLPP